MTVVSRDIERAVSAHTSVRASAAETQGLAAVSFAAWLTVERLLYALALVVAGIMRFWNLGSAPLQPMEAANAWAAYLAAQGQSVADAPAPTSALLYGVQWLLYWIGVDGDAGPRLAGAGAGMLLVSAVWCWRSWIGRGAALALVWIVALDPWLVAISRLADGAALGLALGLVTLGGMMRVASSMNGGERTIWPRVSAMAAGLLMVSGVLAWSWLPVLGLFAWLYRRPLREAGLFSRQSAVWGAVAAVLGATCGLARVDGVAAIGTSLSAWLAQIIGPVQYSAGWPWVRLVVDEPLPAVLGLMGLVVMTVRGRAGAMAAPGSAPRRVFLWGWLAWGMLLWVLPGRSPLALPMVGLPLLVGASWAFADLVGRRPDDLDWREASALVATLSVLMISGSFWAIAFFFNRTYDPVMAQATAVIFLLTGAILAIYAFWANRRHAAWMALLLVVVVLGLSTLRSGHLLNHVSDPGKMDGFYARVTHPEIRLLVDDLETLSAHRTGTPHQLPVLIQVASDRAASGELLAAVPDPVLGWYTRAMVNVEWAPVPAPAASVNDLGEPTSAVQAVAITLMGDAQAEGEDADARSGNSLPSGYVGSKYQIEVSWLPNRAALSRASGVDDTVADGIAGRWSPWVQPLARWLIYRDVVGSVATRDVVMWVQAITD